MSQEKVDKRKYEKKHRAAIMRRQKRHKIIAWGIFGIFVGCILAATLGVKIYKAIPKYVDAEKLNAYVSEVWAEGGYGSEYFPSSDEDTDTASDTDAEESDTSEDTTDTSETADDSSEEATDTSDTSDTEEDTDTDSSEE